MIPSSFDDLYGEYAADWVLVAKDPSYFDDKEVHAALRPFPNYPELIVWSDDFSNLFDVLH